MPVHIETDVKTKFIIPIPTKTSLNRKFYFLYRKELKSAIWMTKFLEDVKDLRERLSF